jgi:hypothetical protein
MKLKTISLKQLKETLSKEKEFSDINNLTFNHIELGEMQHTYKVSNNNKTYFIKEVKPHEAQAEYFLSKLKLKRLPWARFPELLKSKILVREFIPGRMLKSKRLDPSLVRDFAKFQNRLNDKKFFKDNNLFNLNNYGRVDEKFYRKGKTYDFSYVSKRLKQLEKYNLEVVDKYWEILNHIREDKKSIVDDFVTMPYARQHHDFREDNIIVFNGSTRLIDWGSSYAHGPFMFDIAPFLIDNKDCYNAFVRASDICGESSKKEIQRWVYVSLAMNFLSVLKWRLHSSEGKTKDKETLRKYLNYEYKTYKRLLK